MHWVRPDATPPPRSLTHAAEREDTLDLTHAQALAGDTAPRRRPRILHRQDRCQDGVGRQAIVRSGRLAEGRTRRSSMRFDAGACTEHNMSAPSGIAIRSSRQNKPEPELSPNTALCDSGVGWPHVSCVRDAAADAAVDLERVRLRAVNNQVLTQPRWSEPCRCHERTIMPRLS